MCTFTIELITTDTLHWALPAMCMELLRKLATRLQKWHFGLQKWHLGLQKWHIRLQKWHLVESVQLGTSVIELVEMKKQY